MNLHTDKTSENKNQAAANSLPKEPGNGESALQLVDKRQPPVSQRKLKEAIDNSPRVQQLKIYQEMVNNGPQVKQLRAYKAMADNFASQTAQRKENQEQETLQGKFKLIQKKENNTANSGSVVQRGRVEALKEQGEIYNKVIKINMAGSGKDTITGEPPKGVRIDEGYDPTAWKSEKPSKVTISVAGPGAPSTKGVASYLGGISDTGSNSIENNAKQVVMLLAELITGIEERPILILIKAHSRNAVAATRIANLVQQKDKRVKLELVVFDPVPGPLHSGQDVKSNISALPESTLVCSVATQYPIGFTPQQVLGAKRIIISRQNHSGGLHQGYLYNGNQYKGSNINSLPVGVYTDDNETKESVIPLKQVDSIENARIRLWDLFKRSRSLSRDSGRLQIIEKEIIHYYFTEAYDESLFENIWKKISSEKASL